MLTTFKIDFYWYFLCFIKFSSIYYSFQYNWQHMRKKSSRKDNYFYKKLNDEVILANLVIDPFLLITFVIVCVYTYMLVFFYGFQHYKNNTIENGNGVCFNETTTRLMGLQYIHTRRRAPSDTQIKIYTSLVIMDVIRNI